LINVELCEGRLEHISRWAFADCTSLKSINIPSTVIVIGERAFSGCSQLWNVELSEGLKRIDNHAFRDCTSLVSIRIPSTVKVISSGAFFACHQLVNVELCEGLECIDQRAFCSCTSLQSIRIPSTVSHIRKNAFRRCQRSLAIEFSEEIEQFVDEVSLLWWNHGNSEESLRTYSFLAQHNIPARLDRIKQRSWKIHIHDRLQRIPEGLKAVNYFDSIESRLASLEHLQNVAPILELALWKSHMEGLANSHLKKLECRYNSLSMGTIIIPNVLSFLVGSPF
jgi:hypothetical protein